MSDAYKQVKAGRLTFKGGELAAGKTMKKKNKKDKKKADEDGAAAGELGGEQSEAAAAAAEAAGGEVYTIDAAKRMKYEELFPVETKKFGYDPSNKSRSAARSVEEALDDRVRKKADRYCK